MEVNREEKLQSEWCLSVHHSGITPHNIASLSTRVRVWHRETRTHSVMDAIPMNHDQH